MMRAGSPRRREVGDARAGSTMNRLYVVEPTLTLTGAAADHRLAVASRDVAQIAQAIAVELKVATRPPPGSRSCPERIAAHAGWIGAVARDLAAHRGKSLVIAGETQPPEVHALAHLINHALGNIGKTVDFIARVDAGPADQIGSLARAGPRCQRRTGRHADHSGR